jgi:hypothetical protein
MRTRWMAAGLAVVAASLLTYEIAWTQGDRMAVFRQQEAKALSEPFKGVTAKGQVEPNLFRVRSTGVTTKPVREAAEAYLASLSDEQRKRTLFAVDDDEWRKWDNRHFPTRQGVSLKEMNPQQRDLAFALLRAGLSAKGLQKTQDIMKLNETLGELANDFDEYNQWLYWITIMGKPSDTEPWGWQLDGHHAIVNYFILKDQVVMTPTFMGSEPVRAEGGRFKGLIVLQDEQNKGHRLFNALDKAQQAKALIRGKKGPTENLAQAYEDNLVLDYAGLPASAMDAKQKDLLLDVIAEYVSNMKEDHAKVRMSEVRAHLDKTHFAWIGSAAPDGVFYYRIHSPVILIEFDHQSRVAPVRTNESSRDHIHTVVRTPNGNDYGKDLLRQHRGTVRH